MVLLLTPLSLKLAMMTVVFMHPQSLHRLLVFLGFTASMNTPCCSASYSTHCLSLWNAHCECQSVWKRSRIPSLEDNTVALVFECLLNDSVCDRVQNVPHVRVFFATRFLQGAVC